MPQRIILVHQFEQQQGETWGLRFSPDGKQLVSSDGNALYLWRLNEHGIWAYERSLPFRHAAYPRFAPNGKMLAFGGEEALIHLISVDGKEVAIFSSPSHADWAFSPDERWFVSSDSTRAILLWDLATYQRSSLAIPFSAYDRTGSKIDVSNESVGRFLFTSDGQRLVFGASSSEGYVHVCFFDPGHRRIVRQKTLPIEGYAQWSNLTQWEDTWDDRSQ